MDWGKMIAAPASGVELVIHAKATQAEIKAVTGWPIELKAPETTRIYNNKMPTHDPYSNPNALIYYECGCGAILDPLTKSFASLNNHASNMGWKLGLVRLAIRLIVLSVGREWNEVYILGLYFTLFMGSLYY